jgi:isoleucyl-tRNA synthetase
MLYGRPPYKALLTHGFVVDGQGHKMSKSVGNVIAPQKVVNSLGAEILRLWIASTDYSHEVSISDEILKRVVESYRRIRNTLRFLLANLADFESTTMVIADEERLEIDRYALAMTAQMQQEVLSHYEKFEFQPAVSRLQRFCSEDLGAFYLDILKDRLYTTGAASVARRSAQSALLDITQILVKLLAPILSFTAEEAWQTLLAATLQQQTELSRITLFAESYHCLPTAAEDHALQNKWARLRTLRAEVIRKLEEIRSAGHIGASLQAEVAITASGNDLILLQSLGQELRFIFIVSHAVVSPGEGDLAVTITASSHTKCERCWHWRPEVGTDTAHPTICTRCINNLFSQGEKRYYA